MGLPGWGRWSKGKVLHSKIPGVGARGERGKWNWRREAVEGVLDNEERSREPRRAGICLERRYEFGDCQGHQVRIDSIGECAAIVLSDSGCSRRVLGSITRCSRYGEAGQQQDTFRCHG